MRSGEESKNNPFVQEQYNSAHKGKRVEEIQEKPEVPKSKH